MNQNLPSFLVDRISIAALATDLYEVTLACPDHFNWQAGDYLWTGLEESDLRPFSIANLRQHSNDLLVLQIAVNDKMRDWWLKVSKSAQWLIKGPIRQYKWPEGDQLIVMLAGGTGITPLLSLLSAHQDALLNRPVMLYWGVRRSELAFAQSELNRLALVYPNFRWYLILSDADAAWDGLKGDLPVVIANQKFEIDVASIQWLICGPWPMAQAIKTWLDEQQVNKHLIQ